ncbi:MAG: class I SAM-dependent methyltransferase [Candidatus Thiodiazotropha sp. (ex. Lucinisca nassula)]|nr:class I SAM-dependent methyltransferase [Candidatus Thiodiazotropha sp. (ex. Lucinisca nassula)]
MDFYNDPERVDEYEKMCDEYDGSDLYTILEKHLAEGNTLLELGSGPGNDLNYLRNRFNVSGSDLSDEFISRFKSKYGSTPFLKLDAVTIDTKEKYDCVFSNKVLHHLEKDNLEKSFKRQKQVIKSNGLFAHTFWLGDKVFTMEDMLFVFYDKDSLLELVSHYFTIRETYIYKEFEDNDSIFIVAENDKYT